MKRNYEDTYTIPEGTVVMLSYGSYSDYEWVCLARAKRDVDVQLAMQEWKAARARTGYGVGSEVAWLVGVSGYFEELPRPLEWNVEFMRVNVPPEN